MNTMRYEDLQHVRKPLGGAGQVVVLDTGALITAEADAMLQALHSRSIGGVDAHLLKLAQKGAKQFMDTYYVGYGDKSIGDCGTATVFIEGVSMLVAKAIQDSQLYNGQESSTRYVDFSKQPFANPEGSAKGAALLESLRAFHLEGLQIMKEELARRHPRQEDEEEKVWQKAINARAFDVMRSFLPAGAATNLSWHGELRQMADHLIRLRNHPLEEVRATAEAIQTALDEMFTSSFKQKKYLATESYTRLWMEQLYYFNFKDEEFADRITRTSNVALERDSLDYALLSEYKEILAARPTKTEPPKFLAEAGQMQFSFLLDFGSFRDLQRHRALVQRMPLLTDSWGFEQWYFEQMPGSLREKAVAFLQTYTRGVRELKLARTAMQYYLPMGYRVACRVTGDLPALMWMAELRSGITVHPTLRVVAQDLGRQMLDKLSRYGLVLYLDESEDRFNYKRGHQDIVEKVTLVDEHQKSPEASAAPGL